MASSVLAVRQGALLRRADPRHIRLTIEMSKSYGHPRFPLVPLLTLLAEPISMGTNTRTDGEPVGLPVLRTNNLTFDGLDTTDLKYLDLPEGKRRTLLMRKSDLLVNRANGSLNQVGKTVEFDLDGDWLYALFLYRIRVDREKVLPAFLAAFLNSPAGRIQIERLARPITLTNINKDEIGTILVPLPDLPGQQALLAPLAAAKRSALDGRQHAANMLVGINDDIEAVLGAAPPALSASCYAVRAADLSNASRMGVSFFHPERMAAIAVIEGLGGIEAKSLSEVADFIEVKDDREDEFPTLGLAAIEQGTGQFVPTADEPAVGKQFEEGDVLWSRLRPRLNKVAVAQRSGRCSPEFYVLRPKEGVRAGYLAAVMRSPFRSPTGGSRDHRKHPPARRPRRRGNRRHPPAGRRRPAARRREDARAGGPVGDASGGRRLRLGLGARHVRGRASGLTAATGTSRRRASGL